MSTPPGQPGSTEDTEPETWPWRCLDCGSTIYHDDEWCLDCQADRSRSTTPPTPEGFLDWMRRQSVPRFSMTVTAISGLELLLTAAWLRLLVDGSVALGTLG